ncbi:hypothetical protein E3N88_04373 [Mikania micrantha]|uniref:DUF4218 domain-containing protein n=1 Tax=Mikania micrantha TaxID=192012 RepID=A0A5N6PU98_9ASTR|nr:hypothetical protein E3N88_04373 [Mikania micrantha]
MHQPDPKSTGNYLLDTSQPFGIQAFQQPFTNSSQQALCSSCQAPDTHKTCNDTSTLPAPLLASKNPQPSPLDQPFRPPARNKAKPEGSIAEGYVVEEAITFCSQYLRGVESKFERHYRADEKKSSDSRNFVLDVFRLNGRGIGKKEVHILPSILMEKAIWFIFNNCQEVQPFLE